MPEGGLWNRAVFALKAVLGLAGGIVVVALVVLVFGAALLVASIAIGATYLSMRWRAGGGKGGAAGGKGMASADREHWRVFGDADGDGRVAGETRHSQAEEAYRHDSAGLKEIEIMVREDDSGGSDL